ncbi:hypothetical protein GGR51DRAFT_568419 [Nemania sp. FL0031]|nr:hypothetical protein GGR51DRAFT_568419 [Nemania sp. FL0031]
MALFDMIYESMAFASLWYYGPSESDITAPRETTLEISDVYQQEDNTDSITEVNTSDGTETEEKATRPDPPCHNEPSPLESVQTKVDTDWYRRNRPCRYRLAIVLMIYWEEHDFGDEMDEGVNRYEWMFRNLYNYEVRRFKIPRRKPHLALVGELVELMRLDSPETLFIIWYGGHGAEHIDRRGSPQWCSHQDPKEQKSVQSGIVSTTLSDCEADILLINDSCNSLTCDRFNGTGVVEAISSSAFSTSTYGSITGDDLSPSMTWAAHKILSSEKCVEEGITVAELHRRICLATQWAGSDKRPHWNGLDPDDGIPTIWDQVYIRTQPVYTRLSADPAGPCGRTRSIVLCKLQDPPVDVYQQPETYIRLSLGLDYPENIDSDRVSNWILSAPFDILKVKLEWEKKEEPAHSDKTPDW